MAGERKGKTYEALVKVALDMLVHKGQLKGNVYWNEKPQNIKIEPDLTVGAAPDTPDIVILITHAGASKKSTMKMWRNLGELSEAKTFLPKIPVVCSVIFDAVAYEALKSLQNFIFDGQLIVGDRKYGNAVQTWVDTYSESLPVDKFEKVEEIARRLRSKSDTELCSFFPLLFQDIKAMTSMRRPELDSLWRMERARKRGIAPKARNTFVRRGVTKLMIFEDVDLALRLYRKQRIPISDIPEYAYTLNLAKKAIGRGVPADSEIANAVDVLTDMHISSILNDFDYSTVAGWLKTLRSVSHLSFIGNYVISAYSELCDPKMLYKQLIKLHADPWALVEKRSAPTEWPPDNVWLLEYLIELIKTLSGSINGFGHAQLGRMVFEKRYCKGSDLTAANGFGGGFGLSAYGFKRKADCKFRADLVHGIAKVISELLSEISTSDLPVLVRKTEVGFIRNVIEAKLCAYVGFDPLWTLIKASVPNAREELVRACFAEAAGLTGSAARMQLGRANNTLINWQSATDQGKDHKVKELCGRAAALRYAWDDKTKMFVPRPGVKKLCLVVDGTWIQSDLDTLVRAGWDEIFYPDEMDKLAKAIV